MILDFHFMLSYLSFLLWETTLMSCFFFFVFPIFLSLSFQPVLLWSPSSLFTFLYYLTDTCLPWGRLRCFVHRRSTKGCSWCCRVSYFTNQEYRELGQQLSPHPRHRVLSLQPSLLYLLLECRFDFRKWFCFQFWVGCKKSIWLSFQMICFQHFFA